MELLITISFLLKAGADDVYSLVFNSLYTTVDPVAMEV